MNDPAGAVAAFPGEVVAGGVLGEGERPVRSAIRWPGGRFDDEAGGFRVIEPGAGNQVSRIWASIESWLSRTAAMPPWAQPEGAVFETALAHQDDAAIPGEAQSSRLAGQSTADDQDIVGFTLFFASLLISGEYSTADRPPVVTFGHKQP